MMGFQSPLFGGDANPYAYDSFNTSYGNGQGLQPSYGGYGLNPTTASGAFNSPQQPGLLGPQAWVGLLGMGAKMFGGQQQQPHVSNWSLPQYNDEPYMGLSRYLQAARASYANRMRF